jgi:2-polyprenyl-3-methyl-5-hydroxy-6-metoxy-1,4-benzoquinol methylase
MAKFGSAEIKGWNLVCPDHALALSVFEDYLQCPYGCVFGIENGIPRFTKDDYSAAFGYQWGQFAKTQLDSNTKLPITSNRLENALGPELWSNLEDRYVLEVGCGAGRFTEVLLGQGAKVFSTDLSGAIETNVLNFPISEKHFAVQADLQKLPLNERTFDIVCCLGVLQHTPNPEASIEALIRYVKPGGWLVIDHYARSISHNLRTAWLFRILLKRLRPKVSMQIVQKIYMISSPLFAKSQNHLYRKILFAVFPIVYFDKEIPGLSPELKTEWGILDTYDSLTDWYKHRRNIREIRSYLVGGQLLNVQTQAGGNGVLGKGQKSA